TPDASQAPLAAMEQLLRRPLVVLPAEAVNLGDSWKAASDLIGAAGPLRQETEYRLAGTVDQDGKSLQQISMTSKFAARTEGRSSKEPSTPLAVKSHEHTGTILFSASDGRVALAEQTQKLVTERPYRETTIVVTLGSVQKTTVTPVGR